MSPSRRGRSLFGELVVPVAVLVLVAVLANVAFAAWLAVRLAVESARVEQERVVEALESSRVALSQQVLVALHQLTGSHFVVWNTAADAPGLSTLPRSALGGVAMPRSTSGTGSVMIEGRRYSLGTARAAGARPERVFILTPVQGPLETTLASTWPVLAVGAVTLAVLVPLGLRTTGRLAGRIAAVERHVATISQGDFGSTLAAAEADDEIGRLAGGVNRMSVTLASLRDTLASGERQRLLGQLAAGFAHELRNAITGARLAIDLHRRRCPAGAPGARGAADESLAVACRQLDIVEEEVRGLLALGRPNDAARVSVDLDALVTEVRDLTAPKCDHVGVRLETGAPVGTTITGLRDALRAALVNLALNAIDAAGPGGTVVIRAESDASQASLVVEDSGPGPPPGLADSIEEPFVTGKPEGIGLGLAVAKAVAERHGGALEWRRDGGRTTFAIRLPHDTMPDDERGLRTTAETHA
jgi:signal transduction histidine kinase